METINICMKQEEIDEKFAEIFAKICYIDSKMSKFKAQFKVVYQQGIIDSQRRFLENK